MCLIHWRVFALVYLSPESFFSKDFLRLIPTTLRNRLTRVLITGESRLPSVYTTEKSRLPSVFTTGESRLPCVSINGELFWTPGSCSTDFEEHSTSFTETSILKKLTVGYFSYLGKCDLKNCLTQGIIIDSPA